MPHFGPILPWLGRPSARSAVPRWAARLPVCPPVRRTESPRSKVGRKEVKNAIRTVNALR